MRVDVMLSKAMALGLASAALGFAASADEYRPAEGQMVRERIFQKTVGPPFDSPLSRLSAQDSLGSTPGSADSHDLRPNLFRREAQPGKRTKKMSNGIRDSSEISSPEREANDEQPSDASRSRGSGKSKGKWSQHQYDLRQQEWDRNNIEVQQADKTSSPEQTLSPGQPSSNGGSLSSSQISPRPEQSPKTHDAADNSESAHDKVHVRFDYAESGSEHIHVRIVCREAHSDTASMCSIHTDSAKHEKELTRHKLRRSQVKALKREAARNDAEMQERCNNPPEPSFHRLLTERYDHRQRLQDLGTLMNKPEHQRLAICILDVVFTAILFEEIGRAMGLIRWQA